MISTIINIRLSTYILINDYLHGFRQGRGADMVMVKDKPSQHPLGILHKPLFQVFLDMNKAYELSDRMGGAGEYKY